MDEEKFRKKSLDKVKSPDTLNDYIRVTSPGVWILLVSVIVLLAGALVWGAFGHVDSTVPASVRLEGGKAVCFIPEENISSVKTGMTVKFAGQEAKIESIGENTGNGYVCVLSKAADLPDGYYEGKIITESIRPFFFLLN